MRGKLTAPLRITRLVRITPAHAGKTQENAETYPGTQDHPRACGENSWKSAVVSRPGGSPPRMRGKPSGSKTANRESRITPAHAGKTRTRASVQPEKRDHPRACGENKRLSEIAGEDVGSPPRMRGKPSEDHSGFSCGRITPAHAGKTSFSLRICSASWDHPRACGENSAVLPVSHIR